MLPHELWDAFHARFPGFLGWTHLSDVGFSKAGDQALVYVTTMEGPLDGSGHWLLLGREAGRWRVIRTRLTWVS